jgi:thiol:disulfide interchange protein
MTKTTFFISLLFSMSISAKQVYKCELNGQITFSDKPCREGTEKPLNLSSSRTPAILDNKTGQLKYSNYKWFEDIKGYQSALKESKKYQTPILIYFQADWCQYCRRLERELLNTHAARTITRQYIKVRITPDNGVNEKALFKQLGGTGYPTMMIQNNPTARPTKLRSMGKKNGEWKVISASTFKEKLLQHSY